MNILEYQADLLRVRYQKTRPSFVEHSDCIELIASNGDRCFIDLEDADLAQYSWGSTKGYFNRTTSRSHPIKPSKIMYLHVLVLERKIGRTLTSSEFCDHSDWNKANNRRHNLRVASKSQNAANAKRHKDAVVQYKGVSQGINTYRVQINFSVTISESGFTSAEEAARFYDSLAAKHHGRFAVFNFPDEWVWDLEGECWRHSKPLV